MDDPRQRIADLERRLADARAAARGENQPVEQPVSAAQLTPGVRPAYAAPQRKRRGADLIGPVIAVLGGGIGLCVGGAAAVTALIPSTALWMSPIVCRSGYEMTYNTSHYSYKPGQSGTTVSFQCVGDGDYYDVNDFAVFVLQSLLVRGRPGRRARPGSTAMAPLAQARLIGGSPCGYRLTNTS